MIDVAPLERTELQSRLDNAIVLMIRAHVGRPCPTRRTVMEWTGIPRRQVWAVLAEVQARGVIEVEVCASAPALRRRLLVVGDKRGTDWTARRPFSQGGRAPKNPPKVGYATGGDRHHGKRKLTEDQVRAVYFDGRSHSKIARSYRVHKSTVDRIKSRTTWPWLALQ